MSKGQRSRYLDRLTTRNQQQRLRKRKRAMRMEPLEDRHLLAADIEIPGSLVERTQLTDAINNVGETDTFILNLDAQQTLSVAIDANGSLVPEIEVVDSSGSTIGGDTGSAGGVASLNNLEIPTAGTYVIFVNGGTTTGTYSGSYTINADIEVESAGGASNDTVATAQSLDGAFETNPRRGAVIGEFTASDTVDYYRVPAGADADAVATIGVRADDNGVGLELVDASGNTVAVALEGGNFDQVIEGYSNAGELFVKVDRGAATVGTEYTLLISQQTGFEVESNGSIPNANAAQDLIGGGVTTSTFSGTRLITEFRGMDSNDTTCNCEPPDTHGIAGPDHVLEVVNTAVAIYNKDGTVAMPPMEITDFFDPSIIAGELFDFDPVVAYDEIEERWVLVILSGAVAGASETDVLYAISDTSDPTGPWTEQQRIDMAGIAPGEFADYPKIGWNADSHIVSVNMFGGTIRTNIVSIDKSTVLDANPATFGVQITDLGPTSFTTTVATMHDSEPGDPMWFVEEASYNDGNTLRVLKMDDTNSPTPTYTRYLIDVDPYSAPPFAAQPGGSFRTNDGRLLNAEMRDDRLVATHAVGQGGRSLARWYEFDVSSGTPQLTQQANIDPGPGIHTFFPSIAINERGDIGITFMQSSNTEFVSMYATGQAAGSELNSMAPPVLVQAGNETYLGGRGGDYSGIGVDPVTDSFWAFNEISVDGPAPNPLWSTWIGEFEIAPNEDQDFYALDLAAGETVTLETSTPYDAPGNIVNDLDPIIEVFDEAGVLLAMDDNSAADGKNALLSFTAPAAGSYRALVRGANETLGAYVLDVDGITFVNDPPEVVGANPVVGLTLNVFPTTIGYDFSEPIDLESVSAADFLIGGLAATSFTFTDGDSVVLGVDPAADQGDGSYTISIAADVIEDYSGLGNLPYSSTFSVDTTGPRVLATSWNGDAIPADLTFNPGPLTFAASFNEGLFSLASPRRGLRTPGIDDIRLTETVSGTEITALAVAYDEDLELFSADFPDLPEGSYELRLISGDGAFEDEIGNDLDGEPTLASLDGTPSGNGEPGGDYALAFSVDVNGVFTDINPFERQMPLGNLLSASRGNEGAISSPTDTDAYTVFVEQDSTLAGVVTPNDATTLMSVELLGQTFTAPGPGQPVVFFPVAASTDGFEEITFSATSATGYTVDLYRNANVDSLADALGPIALDATDLVSTQDVYNAVGSTTGS
ncbi:MAG: pre-peptidase C-terminal domain-containing protein, partial [Planctomycetota bacterium]